MAEIAPRHDDLIGYHEITVKLRHCENRPSPCLPSRPSQARQSGQARPDDTQTHLTTIPENGREPSARRTARTLSALKACRASPPASPPPHPSPTRSGVNFRHIPTGIFQQVRTDRRLVSTQAGTGTLENVRYFLLLRPYPPNSTGLARCLLRPERGRFSACGLPHQRREISRLRQPSLAEDL